MNSWELFEAMTELEDDTILTAAQTPPRRRLRFRPMLRHLCAACVALALLFTGMVVFDAEAGDATMRWTRRIREDRVYYVFWNSPGETPEGAPPYAPTWLPEDYALTTDWSDESKHSFIWSHRDNEMESIWFSCSYVGDGHQHGYGLEEGTYTRNSLVINGIEADHYMETDTGGGWLVWIDRKEQILFAVSYHNGAAFEDALRLAESVQRTEGEGT